jgi:hypothetical protein
VIGLRKTILSAADHRYDGLHHALQNVTKMSKSLAMMGLK